MVTCCFVSTTVVSTTDSGFISVLSPWKLVLTVGSVLASVVITSGPTVVNVSLVFNSVVVTAGSVLMTSDTVLITDVKKFTTLSSVLMTLGSTAASVVSSSEEPSDDEQSPEHGSLPGPSYTVAVVDSAVVVVVG